MTIEEAIEIGFKNNLACENVAIFSEELAELIQAISKMERKKVTSRGYTQSEKNVARLNVIEEIADVYIVLKMMEHHYDIDDDTIQSEIIRKLKRNLARLGITEVFEEEK